MLGMLRWGDYPELSGWAQWNYRIFTRRKQEDRESVSEKEIGRQKQRKDRFKGAKL